MCLPSVGVGLKIVNLFEGLVMCGVVCGPCVWIQNIKN